MELFKLRLNHDLTVLQKFHRVVKLVWHERKLLQRSQDTVIKYLPKKDRTKHGNYHGIILLVEHTAKVFLNIICTRFSAYREAKGSPAPLDDGHDVRGASAARNGEESARTTVPVLLRSTEAYVSVDRKLL